MCRDDLTYHANVLSKSATVSQRTQLVNKYQRFAARVKRFEEQASQLMYVDAGDFPHPTVPVDEDMAGDCDQMATNDSYEPENQLLAHKRVVLSMPSSFSTVDRIRIRWTALAEREIELREAQAQDALRGLRQTLGERSLCFQKVVRSSKSQETSSRARSKIGMYDKMANKNKKAYKRASEAMWRLGKTRLQWPELRDEHLKMKSEYDEERRLEAEIGESSYQLPWIWTFNGVNISSDIDGDTACS